MYVEYRRKGSDSKHWSGFGGRINPGRNYSLFGILSRGVRSNVPTGFEPKGLPTDLGWYSADDAFLWIDDEYQDQEKYCSMERAERWGGKIYHRDGKPFKTDHPD